MKVLSNGKVGIGTTTPKYSLLDIGKAGTAGGLTIYNSALTNPLLFKLYSNGDYGYLNFGGVSAKGITINKFEIMKPTLNDIFIEKVGE